MVSNLRPSRSEAADVSAAVSSGADGLCLDDETAFGDYPANSVTMLCRCAVEAEHTFDFKKEFIDFKLFCPAPEGSLESVAYGAVQSTVDLDVAVIAVFTESGKLARQVARYKPDRAVVVVSSNPSIARQMSI